MDADIEPPPSAPTYEPKSPRRGRDTTAGEWDAYLRRWYDARARMTPDQVAAEQACYAADYNRIRWPNWWRRVVWRGSLAPAQLAWVWEPLDRVTFHEVVEVSAADPPLPPRGGGVRGRSRPLGV